MVFKFFYFRCVGAGYFSQRQIMKASIFFIEPFIKLVLGFDKLYNCIHERVYH